MLVGGDLLLEQQISGLDTDCLASAVSAWSLVGVQGMLTSYGIVGSCTIFMCWRIELEM